MSQKGLEPAGTGISYNDRVCSRCMGHRALCGISPCPLLMRAKALSDIENAVSGLDLAGSSPPSVFVGSHGYPKVLAGPLVPPIHGRETSLMERPDLWLEKTLDEILSLRFSLVRTKKPIPVDAAVEPPKVLHETQTMALSETPLESEAELIKRPSFTTIFSQRTLPIGPSAPLQLFKLSDNPAVPKPVDKVTSDTDLKATSGVMDLFEEGINQQHISRLLSIGLLGEKKQRKLVPTEWSITAIDDIIGKQLHKRVLRYKWINDIRVYADYALGNKVIALFVPTVWQFEALECWLGPPNPPILSDYEWHKGRKNYANNVVGAYYATRLPVLEQLDEMKRQAGALIFMEVNPKKWVPLGVWRFREIARRAFAKGGRRFSELEEALDLISYLLEQPLERYLESSELYNEYTSQKQLTEFF